MKETIDRDKTMDRMGVKPRQMLEYARSIMNDDQYSRLLKAYRQQRLIQALFLIAMVVLLLLSALLLPVYSKSLGLGILLVVVCTLVWSFASPYITGEPWRRYIRWYRKGRKMEELSKIFC